MNKHKNISRFLLILLVLFGFSSCTEWLSVEPENDLIKEEFWAKTEDVHAVLAATYDGLRECAPESFMLGEVRADVVNLSGVQQDEYNRIAGADISPTNSKVKWDKYYNAINLANTLMFFAPEVLDKDKTYTEKMNDGIRAEALFIRSLCYFYMVRIWKDVPLVLQATVSDTIQILLPKSPEQVILSQIKRDLLEANELAYTNEFEDFLPYYKGRANKYAILALLADVCLWGEDYEECISYCNQIINTGRFSLESYNTYFDLFYPGNSVTESIFELQYDETYESQRNPIYDNLLSSIRVPATFRDLYQESDLRGNKNPTWKYTGKSWSTSARRSSEEEDANFIYYRYADVLFMKAEASAELNRLMDANSILKIIAERSGISHIDVINKEDLASTILDERAKEFALEGKRWFDVLRYAKRNNFEKKSVISSMILESVEGVQERAIMASRVHDTMSYYLPVAYQELLYNPYLEQNSYYDR